MKVSKVWVTPKAERVMAYCARVSSPQNQLAKEDDYAGLLSYCWRKGHVSVFEQAYLCLEIETNLAIATQLLRHRSFVFQQFSQRYSKAAEFDLNLPARRQDTANRQNSIDDLPEDLKRWWYDTLQQNSRRAEILYEEALAKGLAKEQARFLLPQNTETRLYMTGNCRSWLHYLQARLKPEAQKEHRVLAEEIAGVFAEEFPVASQFLYP